MSVLGRRSYGLIRRRGLCLVVLAILSLTALPAAAAQADDTWTGASSSSAWSDSANWTAGVPAGAAGVLTFPTLTGCGAPSVCYTSDNGLSGVSAAGVVFSNTAGRYSIVGNGLTVGASGISDDPGGNMATAINVPLSLGAAQTWTVGRGSGSAYDSLYVTGGVSGSASALRVVFPATGFGDLGVNSDMEVGPVTVSGDGGFHVGGPITPGSVNGSDGNAVAIQSGATLIANPAATVGPLSITGAKLLLGTNPTNTGTVTLGVKGAFSINSASTTTTLINNNGSTPGTDFSQVSAIGSVTLAGRLKVEQGAAASGCVALNPGDVATLFQTTGGTLSGTFANAPEGAVLTLTPACSSAAPQVQIHYTSTSVVATVVSGGTVGTPTTTTLATPSPSPAAANQPVTLTATVSDSSATPSGTVAFSANGILISGCTSQPVTASGSSGTATCSTSFAAGGSPESLTATFTGSSGSGQAGSSSSTQSLTVNKGSTTTTLATSNTSPTVGGNVTYTATVTPGIAGASKPSGTVTFLDGGSPISGCTAQPLTAGSSSGTATCTVSYPSTGSHTITATYGGDADFTGSSSPATTATVQAPTTTFPTTSVLDTFSQSPGPLSSSWQSPALQDAGQVSVASSGQTVSSGGAASAAWKATSFGANQQAYLTVPVLPAAGDFFQVGGRVSSLTGSSVSLYFLRVTPSKNLWDLRKKLNGAASTSMVTFTAPFAAGDSAGLQLNGSTIAAWHQTGTGSWTSVGSVINTSITAGGYVMFTLGDKTMRGGAFGGGNGS
jgi:Bacterial Ig-like domain (group 3)